MQAFLLGLSSSQLWENSQVNQFPRAFVSTKEQDPLVFPNLAEMTGNFGLASSSPDPVGRLTCVQLNDLFTAGLMESFARSALVFLENQQLRK